MYFIFCQSNLTNAHSYLTFTANLRPQAYPVLPFSTRIIHLSNLTAYYRCAAPFHSLNVARGVLSSIRNIGDLRWRKLHRGMIQRSLQLASLKKFRHNDLLEHRL